MSKSCYFPPPRKCNVEVDGVTNEKRSQWPRSPKNISDNARSFRVDAFQPKEEIDATFNQKMSPTSADESPNSKPSSPKAEDVDEQLLTTAERQRRARLHRRNQEVAKGRQETIAVAASFSERMNGSPKSQTNLSPVASDSRKLHF